MKTEPFKLSDSELATQIDALLAEQRKRLAMTIKGRASLIYGLESAKRCCLVAAAGNHSLLFVGPPDSGKTMLRAFAYELGADKIYEIRPCPCGYLGNPKRACSCTLAAIKKYKLPKADIFCETFEVPSRERTPNNATSGDYYKEQLERCKNVVVSPILDSDGKKLLQYAENELELTIAGVERCQRVAQTIAKLDGDTTIKSQHILEAIQYRERRSKT